MSLNNHGRCPLQVGFSWNMLTPLSTGIIFVSSRVFEDYLAENLQKHQIFSGEGKKKKKVFGVKAAGAGILR